ncbi:MAG: hypothetical protein HOV67_00865 [Kribbellaceae bacterium]|nr:hypothetical protein [Kribbellaceae bacterium]
MGNEHFLIAFPGVEEVRVSMVGYTATYRRLLLASIATVAYAIVATLCWVGVTLAVGSESIMAGALVGLFGAAVIMGPAVWMWAYLPNRIDFRSDGVMQARSHMRTVEIPIREITSVSKPMTGLGTRAVVRWGIGRQLYIILWFKDSKELYRRIDTFGRQQGG